MLNYILPILLFLSSSNVFAQTLNEKKKLAEIFSTDILKLNFPDGLTLSSMSNITSKNGYKIYFDDNVDTNLSINQKNTRINSLDLFKSYIEKFNLQYNIEDDFLIHIYKDKNHVNTIPYSYSSFFFVSKEKYGCYSKIHDIMDKYNMKLIMSDAIDSNISEYGFDEVIAKNAVYNQNRISFTCISKDDEQEFLVLTITGFKYSEVIYQSIMFKNDLTK